MVKEKKPKKSQERKNKPVCQNCGLSNGYFRLKTSEWICRSCGSITSLKKGVKGNGQ